MQRNPQTSIAGTVIHPKIMANLVSDFFLSFPFSSFLLSFSIFWTYLAYGPPISGFKSGSFSLLRSFFLSIELLMIAAKMVETNIIRNRDKYIPQFSITSVTAAPTATKAKKAPIAIAKHKNITPMSHILVKCTQYLTFMQIHCNPSAASRKDAATSSVKPYIRRLAMLE